MTDQLNLDLIGVELIGQATQSRRVDTSLLTSKRFLELRAKGLGSSQKSVDLHLDVCVRVSASHRL